MCRTSNRRRGAALVTVLWLAAALAVIGFSVASSVRGDVGRTENALEGARADLLARGAIERLMFFFFNPPVREPGKTLEYEEGQQRMYWRFPGGDVLVEMLPEAGKLNVNAASPQELAGVMLAAGYPIEVVRQLTESIIDRRTVPPGGVSPLDSYYLSIAPTFRPRHASFEQIEELLMVRGVTPHLYYGGLEREPGGPVIGRPGLRDLLSVYGETKIFDANSADPAILRAAGLAPGDVDTVLAMRKQAQITPDALSTLTLTTGPAIRSLRAGTHQAYTVKATARPRRPDGRLSDFRLTSAALVLFEANGSYQIPAIKVWYGATTTDTPWPEAAH